MPFRWFNRYCKLLERRDPVTSSSSSFLSFLSLGHRTNSWTQGLFKQCYQLSDWRQMTSLIWVLFFCVCFFLVFLPHNFLKTCLYLYIWLSWKEPACQCSRCTGLRLDPWVGRITWKRKWQPAPVLLPEKFHGQRSPEGYSPWGCKELDMTEHTHTHTHTHRVTHWYENNYTLVWELGLSFWLFYNWLC